MTVYIGNAVGDEHGNARGGEAGDQTGKEVKIQPWYLSKKGWMVFRPKSAETAQKLVYDMKAACENSCIGYDQSQRNTLYNVSKPFGFDCAEVAVPCECDCSSLVRVCVLYSGIKVNDFNTASEPTRLLATGEFDEMVGEEYTDSYKKLKAGDILCTKVKGHTAIVLNDGPDVAPEPQPEPPDPPTPPDPPEPPEPTKQMVYVIGRSVNVRDSDSKSGKILFTAHKGDTFPFVAVAPSGWYEIQTKKGQGFITNLPRYTTLV